MDAGGGPEPDCTWIGLIQIQNYDDAKVVLIVAFILGLLGDPPSFRFTPKVVSDCYTSYITLIDSQIEINNYAKISTLIAKFTTHDSIKMTNQ